MAKRFKLTGYFKNKHLYEFSFVVPAFLAGNGIVRCEIEPVSSVIKAFYPTETEVVLEVPDIFSNTTFTAGDSAPFLFFFRGTIYGGDKQRISEELTLIIKNYSLTAVDLYEIYVFLNVPDKIQESLNKILVELEEFGLTKDNFYSPQEKKIKSEELPAYYKSAANVLQASRRLFDFNDYFRTCGHNDLNIKINGCVIERDEIKDKFTSLINADQ